ncbi:helix-turn-helix domain-containing protein [Pseudomonas viridiflava]|uniref:helix-turn-helix domain-containing protein n=1 Tax=Pseudomonas viridiflava TaxID=33069 RepID=UPI0013CF248B|nr:helix-turn-helix transcriptional regulator [Pseudomonas viridiflava]
MSFETALGAVLRGLRIRRGWTQVQFDGVVSPQYLSELEFGKRVPSLLILRGICAHLEVELATVLILAAALDDRELDPEDIISRVQHELATLK